MGPGIPCRKAFSPSVEGSPTRPSLPQRRHCKNLLPRTNGGIPRIQDVRVPDGLAVNALQLCTSHPVERADPLRGGFRFLDYVGASREMSKGAGPGNMDPPVQDVRGSLSLPLPDNTPPFKGLTPCATARMVIATMPTGLCGLLETSWWFCKSLEFSTEPMSLPPIITRQYHHVS